MRINTIILILFFTVSLNAQKMDNFLGIKTIMLDCKGHNYGVVNVLGETLDRYTKGDIYVDIKNDYILTNTIYGKDKFVKLPILVRNGNTIVCSSYNDSQTYYFTFMDEVVFVVTQFVDNVVVLCLLDPNGGTENDMNFLKQIIEEGIACKIMADHYTEDKKEERIKMTKSGSVYKIPAEINDVLKVDFLLDTGASDVFISPEIALTLMRTGTLSDKDYLGSSVYSFANGKTESCKKYKLKKLKIGSKEIRDVECAVANDIIGDMLLGQSFLQKLGGFEIDYLTNEIIVK